MPTFISGLDLGQQQEFSALVTLEHHQIPDSERKGVTLNRFDVRHIHRWELRTSYPNIIEDLKKWYTSTVLSNSKLIVDGTGVGQGVVDMLRDADIPAGLESFTITAGFRTGEGTVPKIDLVGVVQAALQTKRLLFAGELELRPLLERELETFRTKVTPDRNETFASWREKDHDDLVLALALAVWWGEKNGGGFYTPHQGPLPRPDAPMPSWEQLRGNKPWG